MLSGPGTDFLLFPSTTHALHSMVSLPLSLLVRARRKKALGTPGEHIGTVNGATVLPRWWPYSLSLKGSLQAWLLWDCSGQR